MSDEVLGGVCLSKKISNTHENVVRQPSNDAQSRDPIGAASVRCGYAVANSSRNAARGVEKNDLRKDVGWGPPSPERYMRFRSKEGAKVADIDVTVAVDFASDRSYGEHISNCAASDWHLEGRSVLDSLEPIHGRNGYDGNKAGGAGRDAGL